MTFATGHLAEPDRVYGRLIKVGALLLVAIKTDAGLCLGSQNRIPRCMDPMAVGAGNVVRFVHATFPGDARIVLMTLKAYLILLLDREPGLGPEIDNWRLFFPGPDLLGMIGAGTVASFALQSGEGRSLIGSLNVFGLEDREDREHGIFVVAFQTGVGTLFRVRRRLVGVG